MKLVKFYDEYNVPVYINPELIIHVRPNYGGINTKFDFAGEKNITVKGKIEDIVRQLEGVKAS